PLSRWGAEETCVRKPFGATERLRSGCTVELEEWDGCAGCRRASPDRPRSWDGCRCGAGRAVRGPLLAGVGVEELVVRGAGDARAGVVADRPAGGVARRAGVVVGGAPFAGAAVGDGAPRGRLVGLLLPVPALLDERVRRLAGGAAVAVDAGDGGRG